MPAHPRLRADREARRRTTGTRAPTRTRPVKPVKIDRQLTFDKLTNVHYSGTRHPRISRRTCIVHDTDICRTQLPRGIRQSVHALLPGQRLRDGGRRRTARRSCRSTRRTACTARRATSWTRTRSSTGCRPKAAAARSTTACDAHVRYSELQAGASIASARSSADRRVGYRGCAGSARRSAGTPRRSSTRSRVRAAADSRSWRSGTDAFFPPPTTSADRGIVVITSENFDGEWIARHHRAIRLRHRARIDVARRRAGRCVQLTRDMAAGKPAAFTVDGPRGPARVAQPGAVWLAEARPAIRSCRFTSRPSRTGRARAGTGTRFRSRAATWRSRSASRFDVAGRRRRSPRLGTARAGRSKERAARARDSRASRRSSSEF